MRIAFIGQKGIPAVSGGVEKHVEELSINLVKLGHEVTVYCRPKYTKKVLKKYHGVKLISLPSIPTKHLDAISHTFLSCLDAIFLRHFDLIHFHSIGPSSLIWLIKIFKPGTPIIATFHDRCYHHKKWGILAKMYLRLGEFVCCRLADKVIAVSKSLKQYADSRHHIDSVYIPNGTRIPSPVPAQMIKARWGLKAGSYIVVISRLIAHKGIHYAIEAYCRLKTDKKLVIVGTGHFTDKYTLRLEKMAEGNPNIIFTGNQSDITLAEFFSNAYFFIQPSESEGLSIALLEAMSFGKAVLVSDIPENIEAIGDSGFTFKNKQVGDLTGKMRYLLKNPGLVRQRGKFGREHVARHNSWDKIADEIVDLYEEAIKEKKLSGSSLLLKESFRN